MVYQTAGQPVAGGFVNTQLNLKPVDGSFSLKEHIYDVLKTSIMDLDI